MKSSFKSRAGYKEARRVYWIWSKHFLYKPALQKKEMFSPYEKKGTIPCSKALLTWYVPKKVIRMKLENKYCISRSTWSILFFSSGKLFCFPTLFLLFSFFLLWMSISRQLICKKKSYIHCHLPVSLSLLEIVCCYKNV